MAAVHPAVVLYRLPTCQGPPPGPLLFGLALVTEASTTWSVFPGQSARMESGPCCISKRVKITTVYKYINKDVMNKIIDRTTSTSTISRAAEAEESGVPGRGGARLEQALPSNLERPLKGRCRATGHAQSTATMLISPYFLK